MFQSGYIAYALIEVRGRSAEEISARMALVDKIAAQNGAVTVTMLSGLVVIARGILPAAMDEPDTGPILVFLLSILSELQGDVRIAYGRELGEFGNVGSESRFNYSFIVPSFRQALAQLVATHFGKITEVV
jgi:hypothetical protein